MVLGDVDHSQPPRRRSYSVKTDLEQERVVFHLPSHDLLACTRDGPRPPEMVRVASQTDILDLPALDLRAERLKHHRKSFWVSVRFHDSRAR